MPCQVFLSSESFVAAAMRPDCIPNATYNDAHHYATSNTEVLLAFSKVSHASTMVRLHV
jgi:hypothetical protein